MNELETSSNERQDQVETRKERDEAGTRNGAEMTNQKRMRNEHNMPTQEINDANEKKGTNASRSMKTDSNGKQEAESNKRLANLSTRTRRTSQRIADAISMKNNRDTKVMDYEELDINAIKYIGNW